MNPTNERKTRGDLVHQIVTVLVKNNAQVAPDTAWVHDFTELITADRKRVALEARIDELNRMLENSEGQLIMRELLLDDDSGTYYYGDTISRDDRIAELKAQQEEV